MVTQLLCKSQSENEKLQHQLTLEREQMQLKYNILEEQLAYALSNAAAKAEEIGDVLIDTKTILEQPRKDLQKLKLQNTEAQ